MKTDYQAELLDNLYGLSTRRLLSLKQGLGRPLGQPRAATKVFWQSVWPKKAYRHNLPEAELAYTLATMFAADPRQGQATLGQAAAVIRGGSAVAASFEKLIASETGVVFCQRLTMLQSMLARDGPALDWAQLLKEMLWWENATWRSQIVARWKKEYQEVISNKMEATDAYSNSRH